MLPSYDVETLIPKLPCTHTGIPKLVDQSYGQKSPHPSPSLASKQLSLLSSYSTIQNFLRRQLYTCKIIPKLVEQQFPPPFPKGLTSPTQTMQQTTSPRRHPKPHPSSPCQTIPPSQKPDRQFTVDHFHTHRSRPHRSIIPPTITHFLLTHIRSVALSALFNLIPNSPYPPPYSSTTQIFRHFFPPPSLTPHGTSSRPLPLLPHLQ